ncbi:OmpA family protein [Polymorphobacter fuscus]|uniref:OmpA family protein n=1 Tax=Sandarakinorhabdus fusca TaxID=1439888 RepID=A0A7C9GWR2_9SPHN|nr:OmpA family protein [Polymorphobacter fuscus]KAB7644490.1 OmpA family protein [Polymorphobacter fuscus]MQT18418.1 OmpA family protein [Polymorphobacter fuscus]NJC08319.1 outer membrane protein OmpA-like peptidoglycan-associated protein [Polymorphobacter fuscus]
MPIKTRILLAVTASSLALAACVTDPETGQQGISRAGGGALAGAGAGALLGALLGGRNNRAEVLIGTGIGAIAGGAIGGYMDRQERELRARTAGTGIEVERQGDEINLKLPAGVTFDFNSAAVKPDFRPALNQVAQTLASFPSTFVDVSGHTDAIGSVAVNQRLSEQRAQSVADYLTYQGVARQRIATRGFGKSMPIASNDTDEGRAQNRRVEIKISPVTEQDMRSPGGAPGYNNPPPRPGTPVRPYPN